MDNELQIQGTVDPEVRAYVYSLVTALGGTGGDELGGYVLGDDALACLRDLKRWLKLYDEKMNRYDVARCLAEANLVNGDLLPILASWPDDGQEHRLMSRIALASLEILVPLTWPLENNESMTVNHHRHMPYLLQAQVAYKRGILNRENSGFLRTAVRIALPSMAIPRSERSSRDEGIIKLLLYFLRNIATITPSAHLPLEGDENEVSRSATIDVFHHQDAFALVLTIASNMGEDFNLQDVAVLEILFHLVKGVNVEKVFMSDDERKKSRNMELKEILRKETGMNREYAKTAPTRHGRFGTMIWVKRADEKVSTVSGQDILMDGVRTLQKMDESKKWNKPTQRNKNDNISFENFDQAVQLNSSATRYLRSFVEDFLDSGFNPLFTHVRKAIEREADRVQDSNYRQFFFLVAWFLEAERLRRARQVENERLKNPGKQLEADSYALVASVLNQETFVALNRYMQNAYDHKEWQDLNASMRCFTQILLTVQEMAQSPLDEDQEIAENIQNRIFYEEATHDRILAILRGYKDQGFGYLDASTELSHVFLRMLERYSKENVDLQIRSRRRARRKRKDNDKPAPEQNADEEGASEAEEIAEAARVSTERKFDFKRFAQKFATQKCVDTFVSLTSYYKDLNVEQLKRAHRFFYRVAFKQEQTIVLFRLDIISLLHRMIKGPGGLDPANGMFKDWDELVKQLLRRMIRKMQERPQLIVELLFSKIPATVYFLEYGEEKQTVSMTRAPAELEVNPHGASTKDQKIAIAVSALIEDGKTPLAHWIAKVLKAATDERISWEQEAESRLSGDAEGHQAEQSSPGAVKHSSIVVKPDSETTRLAMYKNAKLRLLMNLVGFERLGIDDELGATWIVSSTFTGSELDAFHKAVEKAIKKPIVELDGYGPGAHLRRKKADQDEAPRADFIDDSEGASDLGEEEFLFPPNPRSKSNALEELKNKRRRKRQDEDTESLKLDDEALDDEALDARRLAREAAALERRRKIKSEAYIHSSDEDSDEEADKLFYAQEEERRKRNERQIMEALRTGQPFEDKLGGKSTRKRKSREEVRSKPKRRRRSDSEVDGTDSEASKNGSENEKGNDSDEDLLFISDRSSQQWKATSSPQQEDADTPVSSQDHEDHHYKDSYVLPEIIDGVGLSPQLLRTKNVDTVDVDQQAVNDEEDGSDVPVQTRTKRRRGLFVIESDSE